MCVRLCIYVLWGGTKDSVTLLYGYLLFKLLPVLPAQLLFFCYYVFTFFQSLILEPVFCDSGEAWETKAFPQRKRQVEDMEDGGSLSWEGPMGSSWLQEH